MLIVHNRLFFQFYLIINLAVGGTNGFFPDGVYNPNPKPWSNNSPTVSYIYVIGTYRCTVS